MDTRENIDANVIWLDSTTTSDILLYFNAFNTYMLLSIFLLSSICSFRIIISLYRVIIAYIILIIKQCILSFSCQTLI